MVSTGRYINWWLSDGYLLLQSQTWSWITWMGIGATTMSIISGGVARQKI